MSDSTEQALKPVTEDEDDHGPPPKEEKDLGDAEKAMTEADAAQEKDG
jgi:hypothetical protein